MVLALGVSACSSHGSSVGDSKQGATTASSQTTSVPPGYQPAPTTLPNPSDCKTGTVSVNATVSMDPVPLCIRVGSVLDVTYGTSWTPPFGSWSGPPTVTDTSVLVRTSSRTTGKTMTATFNAVGVGATQVNATFSQQCAPTDTSPCTIPPQIPYFLGVTVVSASYG